jgi:hypothetical protein
VTGTAVNSPLKFKASLSPKVLDVAPGKTVKYRARLANADKKDILEGLFLSVQLPTAGVTYLFSKSSSAYNVTGMKGNKATYQVVKGGKPAIVNSTAVPVAVIWDGLALPPRKNMQLGVDVRVAQGARHGMPLTFHSTVYQQLDANGLQYCPRSYNETVVVKTK